MAKYNTKQRELISMCLKSNPAKIFTVDEICASLSDVGRTTVYRQLDALVREGLVRNYTTTGSTAASYQYITDNCREHYHLKCASCGALIHIDCDEINHLKNHFLNDHNFALDMSKTVLYGLCGDCNHKA